MSWQLNELELDQIAVWPSGAKFLLLALVALLLCLSGSYFFLAEPWGQWQQMRAQEAELKRTFIHKTQAAAHLSTYQHQLARLEQQVTRAQQQLPQQRQAANLLNELSALADENGLVLAGFQWQAERTRAEARELPLQLNLQGDYHQLGHFVAQVSALPRLVVIERLDIRRLNAWQDPSGHNKATRPRSFNGPAESTAAELTMSLLATAYVYPAEERSLEP
ncbi:type 4a pilus biogenesis protein PilO [Oceanisphaera sp. W20_SRM_FM3]|uniref:type 4a pilus biogenesis protein PilO n=1 Tax=Oceanisphaera sp. W20_SRM_FM3 TaxID=3240267 RepID=UPI003F95C9E7